MKKLLEKIKNVFGSIFSSYPFTLISALLFGLVLGLFLDKFSSMFYITLVTLSLFAILSFGVESLKKKNNLFIVIAFILSLLIGVGSYYLMDDYNILTERLLVFIYVAGLLFGFMVNYKKSKKTFSKYLMNIFENGLIVYIFNQVLSIGISIIMVFLFCLLIPFDSLKVFEILLRIALAISVPYGTMNYIFLLTREKETNNITEKLISYFAYPVILITYFIVYVYLISITISSKMPNNSVFLLVSLLFLISMFISSISKELKDDNYIKKINKFMPIIFIPLMLLQTYAMYLRVNEYGITIARYLGFAFVIFEIYCIAVKLLKEKEEYVCYAFMIVLFISLLFPGLNCVNISARSQFGIVKEYKATHQINKKIKGAYEYLLLIDREDILNDYFNENEIKELDESYFYSEFIDEDEEHNFNSSISYDDLDITGYDDIKFIDGETIDSDYYNDLKEIFDQYVEMDSNEYFQNNHEFIINDKKYILEYVDIESRNGEIDYCRFGGYVLTKKANS